MPYEALLIEVVVDAKLKKDTELDDKQRKLDQARAACRIRLHAAKDKKKEVEKRLRGLNRDFKCLRSRCLNHQRLLDQLPDLQGLPQPLTTN